MPDAQRDVLIRILTSFVQEGAPPDLKPFVDAQKEVKGASDDASQSVEKQIESVRTLGETGKSALAGMFSEVRSELDALNRTTQAWRDAEAAARDYGNLQLKPAAGGGIPGLKSDAEAEGVDRHTAALEREAQARMDAQVAAAAEATAREKAVGVILQEEDAEQQATKSHHAHAASLAHSARPLNMMIHSAMNLAHSFALLTAANEQDAEAMVRKLMAYEGWIMAATGSIHMIEAMHKAYEALEAQAWLTAAAEAAAMAPLTLVVAVVGSLAAIAASIWKIGDAFDWWGSAREEAAKEAQKAQLAIEGMTKAGRNAELEISKATFEGHEKKQGILEHTDPHRHGLMSGHRIGEIDKELAENQKRQRTARRSLDDLDDAHAKQRKELNEKILKEQNPEGSTLKHLFGGAHHEETRDEYKARQAKLDEQEIRQLEARKQAAEQIRQTEEQGLALAQRKIGVFTEERDHLEKNVKAQMELVKGAEREVEIAKGKRDASDESFGRLDEAKQGELRRIGKKFKEGKGLTKNEWEHVESYGDEEAKALAKEHYRQKGITDKKGDAANLHREGHAPGQDIKGAESQAAEAKVQLGRMQKELNAKEAELKKAGVSAMTAVDKLTETTTDLVQKLNRKIEELNVTLERMRDGK